MLRTYLQQYWRPDYLASETVRGIRRRKAAQSEVQRLREIVEAHERVATHKGAEELMTDVTHVESKDPRFAGISQIVVDRHGDRLERLLDPRSPGSFAFQYDRSSARDGSDITTPLSCSRHRQDNWKRGEGGRGWLAIRLVESWADHAVGTQWRDVIELPADLKIAGSSEAA